MLQLGLAWLLSRLVLGWVTVHDDAGIYRDRAPAAHDITLYDFWAEQVASGARPYVDFALEYPPANLPLLIGPGVGSTLTGRSYETTFVAMAVLVDGIALLGLLRLAASGGSWVGPAAWVGLVPILGPVALSRLDVVPAAAVVWAVVLARSRRWTGSGALVGLATGTKVFAGLLVPVWTLWAPRPARVRFVAGAAACVAMPLLAFADVPGALIDDVWQYHSGRGLAAESSWGSILLAEHVWSDATATVELRSGSWEIIDPRAGVLKTVATLMVAGIALHATLLARRDAGHADLAWLATLTASTVVLSVALGNVLSPQYLVWCIGAVSAAAALGVPLRAPLALLAGASAASHLVFPLLFWELLFDQTAMSTGMLLIRNGFLVACGYSLLQRARAGRSDPGVEQQQRLPAPAGDRGTDPQRQVDEPGADDGDRDERREPAPHPV